MLVAVAIWIGGIVSLDGEQSIGLQDSCRMFGGNGGVLCVPCGLPDVMDDVLLLMLTNFRIAEVCQVLMQEQNPG
jgi:hypothetical protein